MAPALALHHRTATTSRTSSSRLLTAGCWPCGAPWRLETGRCAQGQGLIWGPAANGAERSAGTVREALTGWATGRRFDQPAPRKAGTPSSPWTWGLGEARAKVVRAPRGPPRPARPGRLSRVSWGPAAAIEGILPDGRGPRPRRKRDRGWAVARPVLPLLHRAPPPPDRAVFTLHIPVRGLRRARRGGPGTGGERAAPSRHGRFGAGPCPGRAHRPAARDGVG